MPTEARHYQVTIPAGTPLAAPVTIDVSFPQMITDRVIWRVPRGPNGLMGWRLTSGGGQVIPKNQGAFIVADNQGGTWELAELHNTGAWQVTGYNTGAFNHSVFLEFHTRPIQSPDPLIGGLGWMAGTPRSDALGLIWQMSAAPEVVKVSAADLWPPRSR